MDDKAKQARNEYMRAYRKKNPDKIKNVNSRYWSRRAERNNQQQQAEPDKL